MESVKVKSIAPSRRMAASAGAPLPESCAVPLNTPPGRSVSLRMGAGMEGARTTTVAEATKLSTGGKSQPSET